MNRLNIIPIINNIKSWYLGLTQRERVIIKFSLSLIMLFIIWTLIENTLDYRVQLQKKVIQTRDQVPQVFQLAERVKNLESRKNELSTLYLNSTLSYEELTNYLDNLIKTNTGSNSYTLNKSQDTESIGDDFSLQKFTIKINDTDFESILKLLNALESGTPRMFLERTDIAKNRNKSNLSLTIELSSVQSK